MVKFLDAWSERILTGHTSVVYSVAVSAAGQVAVSCGTDMVRVWDLGSGSCLHTLPGSTPVAVSADARVAASGGDGKTVLVWDLDRGTCLHTLTGHTDAVWSIAVSADGRFAVSCGNDAVRMWDLVTGACLRTLTGHSGLVTSVAMSGEGRTAVSSGEDKIRVWDLARRSVRPLRLRACVRTLPSGGAVALSADGRIAVCCYDKAMRVWDLGSGACLSTLTGHTEEVMAVAVSADGRVGVSAAEDKTVRVWDLSSGACLRILTGHTGHVVSVALSADASIAVSGSRHDKAVRVWALDWDYEFADRIGRPGSPG